MGERSVKFKWIHEIQTWRKIMLSHMYLLLGICQSGDYSETPMYSADITGEGQIFGVADTGNTISNYT